MSLEVNFKAKSKLPKLPGEVVLSKDELALSLFEIVAKDTKLHQSRIRLTVKSDKPATEGAKTKDYVLAPSDKIASFAVDGKVTVYVRDLGPQIAWRTVFLIEYLGPLLIHPLFFYAQKLLYGETYEHTTAQTIVFYMVLLHFVKRELETAFVHKFSLATMPLFNLFKNCTHYWLLSGVLLAYFVYAPVSWASRSGLDKVLYGSEFFEWTPLQLKLLVAAWAVAELSNLVVHLNLASLRKPGSTERKIPYGYGFDHVSCPNYTFEAWGWLIVSLIGQNWSVWLFFIVGSLQMYAWAVKKHKRYIREFPDYPKNRTAMIPFVC